MMKMTYNTVQKTLESRLLFAMLLTFGLQTPGTSLAESDSAKADRASIFASIAKVYHTKAYDNGGFPSSLLDYHTLGLRVGEHLEQHSRVSARCLFDVRRDGKRSPTGAVIGLVAGLEDVMRSHAAKGLASLQTVVAARVRSFAASPGCSRYEPAAQSLLLAFSEFAQPMVASHLEKITKRNDEARIAAQSGREQAQRHNHARRRTAEETEVRRAADQEQQRQERLLALKDGAAPESFKDHYLLLDPQNAQFDLANPPLDPIKGPVIFRGQIVREENGGYLLLLTTRVPAYVKLVRSASSAVEGTLHINGHVNVIGRHVGNRQYETVLGAVKTVP